MYCTQAAVLEQCSLTEYLRVYVCVCYRFSFFFFWYQGMLYASFFGLILHPQLRLRLGDT